MQVMKVTNDTDPENNSLSVTLVNTGAANTNVVNYRRHYKWHLVRGMAVNTLPFIRLERVA